MGREARGGPEEDDIHWTSVRKVELTSDLLLFHCCITIYVYVYIQRGKSSENAWIYRYFMKKVLTATSAAPSGIDR